MATLEWLASKTVIYKDLLATNRLTEENFRRESWPKVATVASNAELTANLRTSNVFSKKKNNQFGTP